MNKYLNKIPRPVKSDDESRFDIEQVVKDIASLVSIASLPTGRNKVARSLTTASAVLSIASIGRNVFMYLQRMAHSNEYTLKLVEKDFLFQIAENWLMEALPDDKKKSIFIKSGVLTKGTGAIKEMYHRVSFDGSVEQEIEVNGFKVRVGTEKPETDAKGSSETRSLQMTPRTIIFKCPSAAARDAVRLELLKQGEKAAESRPGFYTARWGSFDRNFDLVDRRADSVFLKENQMERILGHIRQFQNNETEYDRYGIPFRTGIMMHGTPGSGKTSTATVIANELDMDIYYLSIRSMEGDQDFENTMARVPANTLVVLEDIDAVKAAKDRDGDKKEAELTHDVSLTSLLNVLDGMQSPRGVVFIMTTNKPEELDEALKRPGRVDLMEELNALDTFQLRAMLSYYTGEDYTDKYVPPLSPEDGITSAEIIQVIREYLPNRDRYADAIIKYIEAKLLTALAK